MRKPSIPGTGSLQREIAMFIEPLKANVELITGSRPGAVSIDPLPATATLADVITQLNKILSRIEHSG
jgi:hypothetical protein